MHEMGQHLQEYVESALLLMLFRWHADTARLTKPDDTRAGVSDLPAELQRSFKLLQELDQKAQTLQQHVDAEVEQRVADSNPAAGCAATNALD